MEKTKQSKETGSSERKAAVLYKLVGEQPTDAVISEHSPEGE